MAFLHFVLLVILGVAARAHPSEAQPCPEGGTIVNCFIEPCLFAQCNQHPDAVCRDDYCGGCFARFFVGETEVTRECRDVDQPLLCVDGTRPVQCFVEPCSVTDCDNHLNATCEDDYCGGCNARFYVAGKEVTDDCHAVSQRQVCADGSPIFNCFAEPCAVTQCEQHSDAICVDDYCGGCNARFYVAGKEVTDDCHAGNTPAVNQCPASEIVMCKTNPCNPDITSCPSIPEATCFDDYCGGCNDRWFLSNCTEVTSACGRLN